MSHTLIKIHQTVSEYTHTFYFTFPTQC